jgi:hypothetical protein
MALIARHARAIDPDAVRGDRSQPTNGRFVDLTHDRSQRGSASETPGAEVPRSQVRNGRLRADGLRPSARGSECSAAVFFLSSIQQRSALGVGSVLDSVRDSVNQSTAASIPIPDPDP